MRRLLLVEDDPGLGETLCERLEKEGYQVNWAENLADARKSFSNQQNFDLIILDVNLPDGSGFEFAREVKRQAPVPFLFVTAMNSAEHRLEGYEIGAEEFIPKPFHLKELLLRVKHVLGTHAPKEETIDESISTGNGRTIDIRAQAVIEDESGKKTFLAARDFQLLRLLIEEAPKVLSRDEILDRVWGEDKFPSHRTVDNSIVRLRQALVDEGSKLIRSVRGVGYQWVAENRPPENRSPKAE